MKSITVQDLHQKIRQGSPVHLLDVRTPAEFQGEHAQDAVNLPLDRLSKKTWDQSKLSQSQEPLYVICQAGGRSSKAIQQLEAEGVQNLINVEGGTSAWIAAQLPTLKGHGVISIERQVRITAGTLVFSGVVLGHFIHPYFYLLPALVGCGLIFAGLSDWCGMGLLLARMPWNK
jgi:rhodanese-related sulfurtransferase